MVEDLVEETEEVEEGEGEDLEGEEEGVGVEEVTVAEEVAGEVPVLLKADQMLRVSAQMFRYL